MPALTINKNDDILLFMAEIILSKGQRVLVDDLDYEWLNQWKWYLNGNYASRAASRKLHPQGKQLRIWMHRVILNPPQGYFTDHINGDKLDNRRENLRVCTTQQNGFNHKVDKRNKTGYTGVVFRPNYGKRKWAVYIPLNRKQKFIGGFENLEKAIQARKDAEKKYWGGFSKW